MGLNKRKNDNEEIRKKKHIVHEPSLKKTRYFAFSLHPMQGWQTFLGTVRQVQFHILRKRQF